MIMDDTEQAKWDRYRATGDDSELLEHYVPWVWYRASVLAARLPGMEADDLANSGMFGLRDAIRSYDPSKRVLFTTFSAMRIAGAMLDEIRKRDIIPRLTRSAARKVAQAQESAGAQACRRINTEELIELSGWTPQQAAKLLTKADVRQFDSLSNPIRMDGDKAEAGTFIPDNRAPRPSSRQMSLDILRLVCHEMNKQERLIIALYYWERYTMREIAVSIGVSESYVSQLHKSIVQRLREALADRRDELITE